MEENQQMPAAPARVTSRLQLQLLTIFLLVALGILLFLPVPIYREGYCLQTDPPQCVQPKVTFGPSVASYLMARLSGKEIQTKPYSIPFPSPIPDNEESQAGTGVACTQEVKQCPDGSYVGRQPPNCEFAPCP